MTAAPVDEPALGPRAGRIGPCLCDGRPLLPESWKDGINSAPSPACRPNLYSADTSCRRRLAPSNHVHTASVNHRESILLVEDDIPLRRLLSLALRLEGFLTFEAGDGLQAIALLEQFTFDAIVLDLHLPGIDGLAVAQEIRAQSSTRTLPVIVMTASHAPIDDIDPACVLRKPVTVAQVIDGVQRCLRQRIADRD
jgi:CheY-like chemotaxis protein